MLFKPGIRRFSWRSSFGCWPIFLVFVTPVEYKFWPYASQQPINESRHLSASDNLWVDEITVQVKDEIYNLRGIHALLDIACESYFVDTDLFWCTLQVVLKTELCGFIFYAKVCWDNHGSRRQTSERFDTFLALHVHGVSTCHVVQRVWARIRRHEVGWLSSLRVRCMCDTICHVTCLTDLFLL